MMKKVKRDVSQSHMSAHEGMFQTAQNPPVTRQIQTHVLGKQTNGSGLPSCG